MAGNPFFSFAALKEHDDTEWVKANELKARDG